MRSANTNLAAVSSRAVGGRSRTARNRCSTLLSRDMPLAARRSSHDGPTMTSPPCVSMICGIAAPTGVHEWRASVRACNPELDGRVRTASIKSLYTSTGRAGSA